MHSSVIDLARAAAVHRDGQRCLSHRQRVLAVGGVVVRVRGTDLHGLRAHVRDARNRLAPACTVVNAVLNLDDIAGNHTRSGGRRMELAAVIDLRQGIAARTGQRDGGLRNRQLHRLTDRPVHRVVVVVVRTGGFNQRRRVVAHSRAGGGLVAAVAELGRIEARGAARRRHRAHVAPLTAGIDQSAVAAVHRDVHGRLRNRQSHRFADGPTDRVVIVVIAAIVGDQSHRVVAHRRAAHGRAAAIAELGSVEARAGARGHCRANVGLRRARIDPARAVAVHRDGHGRLVDRQLTVHHVECHRLEVGVRVLEEPLHEVHVRGAGIRAGGRAVGNATGEVNIVGIVTRRCGVRDRVARHRMRLSVIGHFFRFTRDRHLGIHLVDGQRTVRDMELDIELVIVVDKLRRIKAHIIGAGIGTGSDGGGRVDEREVTLIVNSSVGNRLRIIRHTANLDLVSADALLCTVVILRGRITRDGHNHNAGRHNLQPTVSHGEGSLEVGIAAGELAGEEAHRISSGERAGGR